MKKLTAIFAICFLVSSTAFASDILQEKISNIENRNEYYQSKLFTLGSISNDIQYGYKGSEYFRIHSDAF